jgi:hypothetical protein
MDQYSATMLVAVVAANTLVQRTGRIEPAKTPVNTTVLPKAVTRDTLPAPPTNKARTSPWLAVSDFVTAAASCAGSVGKILDICFDPQFDKILRLYATIAADMLVIVIVSSQNATHHHATSLITACFATRS